MNHVHVGQVWRWKTPNGGWREMLVERLQNGPGCVRRAYGRLTTNGKKAQVSCCLLEHGQYEAVLVRVIEDFVFRRRSCTA